MGRKLVIAMFLGLICGVNGASAAPAHNGVAGKAAVADVLQSCIEAVTRIVGWIPEPLGLVLAGICVIGFSWFVGRRLSRARR